MLKKWWGEWSKFLDDCYENPQKAFMDFEKRDLINKGIVYSFHHIGRFSQWIIDVTEEKINARNEKKCRKLNAERKGKRSEELVEIEKNFSDPQTKKALSELAGITNKHYKKCQTISFRINEFRKTAPTDNVAVQRRIEEIIGSRR